MALADHPSFPQPPDQSELVWRYLDTPKLLSLLLHRALYLGRVDLFPDKFEGTHTRPTREALLRQLTAPPPGPGMTSEQAASVVAHIMSNPKIFRKTMFASCWCLRNYESEAMWRLYCGTGERVALVLPYARLKDSLTDLLTFIGKVTYLDYGRDFIQMDNVFNYVMHKRREFQHESEVRIAGTRMLPSLMGEGWETRMPTSVSLPWEARDHVDRIVVRPYASPWYLETIREAVAQIAPGLEDRVQPSSMGGDPPT